MKLEIYHEEKETVVEEPVRLKLKTDRSGRIILAAVNKNGDTKSAGNLIRIETNGTFYREGYVNPKLGFKLDSANKIVETE